jgi:hypothetical protein
VRLMPPPAPAHRTQINSSRAGNLWRAGPPAPEAPRPPLNCSTASFRQLEIFGRADWTESQTMTVDWVSSEPLEAQGKLR